VKPEVLLLFFFAEEACTSNQAKTSWGFAVWQRLKAGGQACMDQEEDGRRHAAGITWCLVTILLGSEESRIRKMSIYEQRAGKGLHLQSRLLLPRNVGRSGLFTTEVDGENPSSSLERAFP